MSQAHSSLRTFVSAWAGTNWSPVYFDNVRIPQLRPASKAILVTHGQFYVTHGQFYALHLILSSRGARLFPGCEPGTRLGFDVHGQGHTRVATGIAPTNMPSYVLHARAYPKLPPSAPPATSAGRQRPTRAPHRVARSLPLIWPVPNSHSQDVLDMEYARRRVFNSI